MSMIKKKIGETMLFTGGAEDSVRAEIIGFHAPGSMNHGEKTIRFSPAMTPCSYGVSVSPKTLRSILKWAEEE